MNRLTRGEPKVPPATVAESRSRLLDTPVLLERPVTESFTDRGHVEGRPHVPRISRLQMSSELGKNVIT